MKCSRIFLRALALVLLLTACGGGGDTGGGEATATLSIQCGSIWDNIDDLDPDKLELVSEDGMILAERSIAFTPGDSVFDLLQRVTREEGLHMESSITPGTGSAYVKGIHNIYEFDCGSLSGWRYMVNGVIPDTAASDHLVEDGDEIIWVYTCDLGRDIQEVGQ